jgi:hypothetical protein
MAAVRFYAPISDGGFLDFIDELSRAGASCASQSQSFARCSWRGARFVIVHDVEGGIRAQLLDDAGLGIHAWDLIESILSRATTRTGWEGMEEREEVFAGVRAPKPGPPPPPPPGACPDNFMWDPTAQNCIPVLPWPIQQSSTNGEFFVSGPSWEMMDWYGYWY